MINLEFLLTSLVVLLVPGTGAIYTITIGLTVDWRASFFAAFGCTLGILPHIIASILSLSALLNASSEIFFLMKLAGAVYLLYLAWQMWRETGLIDLNKEVTERSAKQIITRAIAINLLNPKLTIFFVAFLPLFTPDQSLAPTLELVVLSVIYMVMTFIVFACYGILASGISTYLTHSLKAIQRLQKVFAPILAGFAVELALSDNR